ncbi:hypothetical protein J6590_010410 [Homalodisca vitripennis]|nr:hypothetical protein J6590_010410 [Homalodisca vitripennis]
MYRGPTTGVWVAAVTVLNWHVPPSLCRSDYTNLLGVTTFHDIVDPPQACGQPRRPSTGVWAAALTVLNWHVPPSLWRSDYTNLLSLTTFLDIVNPHRRVSSRDYTNLLSLTTFLDIVNPHRRVGSHDYTNLLSLTTFLDIVNPHRRVSSRDYTNLLSLTTFHDIVDPPQACGQPRSLRPSTGVWAATVTVLNWHPTFALALTTFLDIVNPHRRVSSRGHCAELACPTFALSFRLQPSTGVWAATVTVLNWHVPPSLCRSDYSNLLGVTTFLDIVDPPQACGQPRSLRPSTGVWATTVTVLNWHVPPSLCRSDYTNLLGVTTFHDIVNPHRRVSSRGHCAELACPTFALARTSTGVWAAAIAVLNWHVPPSLWRSDYTNLNLHRRVGSRGHCSELARPTFALARPSTGVWAAAVTVLNWHVPPSLWRSDYTNLLGVTTFHDIVNPHRRVSSRGHCAELARPTFALAFRLH